MARTRKNPDTVGLLLLIGAGLGGVLLYERWKGNQSLPQSYNGATGGTVYSPATGLTFSTSHPSGHGQIYV